MRRIEPAELPRTAARARYDRWMTRQLRSIVMQPTSLCNLNCHYCYLPERQRRQEMPLPVAVAVAASVQSAEHAAAAPPVGVIWHGGEPLAIGLERFVQLLEPFEVMRRQGWVRHSIQTNATLITDSWCELFQELGVCVGVSIDGPAVQNQNRVDWRGEPAHERIVRGIELLGKFSIPFSIITVVKRDSLALRN